MGTGHKGGRQPDPVIVASFWSNVRAAWEAAGPPSYPTMVKIMKQQGKLRGSRALGKSALQAMMTGKNTTLPLWEVLSAVIYALHIAAADTHLDPEAIGSIGQWHTQLQAAKNSEDLRQGEAAVDGGASADGVPTAAHLLSLVHPESETVAPDDDITFEITFELALAAGDENHPEHGRAAYELAILALCQGEKHAADRWMKVSALAEHQPARALICARDQRGTALAAALQISQDHQDHGRADLARLFLKATHAAA